MAKEFWTPEKRLAVKTDIEAGLSYREIGKKFGRTRSAIAGAVQRWKVKPDVQKKKLSKKEQDANKKIRKCSRCKKPALYNCDHCATHLVQRLPIRININKIHKKIV